MNFKSLALLTAVVLAFACKKYDIHPPVLTEITIDNKTDDIVLKAGTNYSMYYKLEDNTGVDYIKIKSVKGFKYEDSVITTASDFAFIYALDYDQKTKSEPIAFNVPSNASAGSYRVIVEISDGNNNVVTEKSLNFVVTNATDDQPKINALLSANANVAGQTSVSTNRGGKLYFTGGITSTNADIVDVKVEVIGQNKNAWSKIINISGTNDLAVDLGALNDSLNLVINPNTAPGDYKVNVYAKNSGSQVGVKSFNLKVAY